MSDLEIQRGSTETLDLLVRDYEDGPTTDITGATLWFVIKRRKSDPDSISLMFKTTPTDILIDPDQTEGGNRGMATVTITSADTKFLVGEFFFAAQILRGGVKKEFVSGTINIAADLVRV